MQFYDKGSDYGLALTSTTAGNGTSLFLQLSAPASFQWAAVGSGDKMDGSLMFLIYRSDDKDGKLIGHFRSIFVETLILA